MTNDSSGNLLADRRYVYAAASLAEGDAAACADLAEQALDIAPGWPAGWFLLGRARASLGDAEKAGDAFRRVLELDADDKLGAGLELALLSPEMRPSAHSAASSAAGSVAASSPMSPAYVTALFDGYAGRFEDHLASLNYRAPTLLRGRVVGLAPFDRALDLGCGTGLMGAELRPHCGWLAGCDLSPEMVEKARARQIYDRLAAIDLTSFLADEAAGSASLVIAADVFVYVGDLQAVFAEAARVLRPGGVFAFTVQAPADASQDAGFVLGEDRRFHHALAYLNTLASADFIVRHQDAEILRLDRGRPVNGFVVVMTRI